MPNKTTKKTVRKKVKPDKSTPLPATGNGSRADYLATNPRARQLQDAQLKQITERIGHFRKKMIGVARDFVKAANDSREIGILIIDFLDTLPGKQLTTDFWQQMEGLFIDCFGNPISQEQLKWFVSIANKNPKPFENIIEAFQFRQTLMLASGADELILESERGPQTSHSPTNPLLELKNVLAFARLEDVYKRLSSDQNYFPDGHLRPDLRDTLIVELKPTFELVDKLKLELGV
jgi:hypothetical protein